MRNNYKTQFAISVVFYNILVISIIRNTQSLFRAIPNSFSDSWISFKKIYYKWSLSVLPNIKNLKRSKSTVSPSTLLSCLCHRYNRVSLKAAKRRRSFMVCCIAAMCLNEIFMQHKERKRSPLLCEGSSFYLFCRVFLTSYQMRIPRVLLGAPSLYEGGGALFLDSQCSARVGILCILIFSSCREQS